MSLREEIERRRATHAVNGNSTNKPNGTVAASMPVNETGESPKAPPASPSAPVPSSPPLFLRLVKLNKQSWLLPWACFHGASYEPICTSADDTDKCERLHLVFMRHEVTVSGHNLAGFVDAIEETNLREVWEICEKYHAVMFAKLEQVIVKIEVNAR